MHVLYIYIYIYIYIHIYIHVYIIHTTAPPGGDTDVPSGQYVPAGQRLVVLSSCVRVQKKYHDLNTCMSTYIYIYIYIYI